MIWEIIILVLAIPVGYLIALLCRDELVAGRVWFEIIILLSFVLGIAYYIKGESYIAWTLAFISIIALISLMKSYDKKWTRKRT